MSLLQPALVPVEESPEITAAEASATLPEPFSSGSCEVDEVVQASNEAVCDADEQSKVGESSLEIQEDCDSADDDCYTWGREPGSMGELEDDELASRRDESEYAVRTPAASELALNTGRDSEISVGTGGFSNFDESPFSGAPNGDLDCASYPTEAANYFGEKYGAHRLRWAHAVNSKRRLRLALCAPAHFLEADVTSGPLVSKEEQAKKGLQEAKSGIPETLVNTACGQPVIMAHYPTELSSDLSFENFMRDVLRHNDRVTLACEASAREPPSDSAGKILLASQADPPCEQFLPGRGKGKGKSMRMSSTSTEEANSFARELDRELEQAAYHGGAIASCVGSRRDIAGRGGVGQLMLKGVKLDFKRFDCVGPCIEHLRTINAAQRLGGHLWLNADVLAGPGALMTPFDAKQFVRLCAEALPEAVLSLSWGASVLSTMKSYSPEMVDRMIELCMTPIVPRELPRPDRENTGSERRRPSKSGGDGQMLFTPAAVCNHITFAVAVEYAYTSAEWLTKLLEAVPGSSLTIYSGYGSVGISPAHVKELLHTYGTNRLFLDLKLSKAWRSCGGKGGCVLQ